MTDFQISSGSPKTSYPAGTILAGRYQVLKRLGDGGMGEVYLVHDPVVDAKVAVKLLHAELVADKRAVDRFSLELKLTREVTTDYIVRTHDVGEHEGRRFFAMEYSDRGSLKARIAEGPLPFAEVVSILSDVCRGLQAIHAKNMVHRDLKPDNVMLFTNREKGGLIAKITDFGIARQGVSELTGPTEVLGSIHYMSPEAWTGQGASPRMDLYSLGCMAYQLASGVLPFDGDIAAEVMWKHTQQPPTPLIEVAEEVPRWFHELVMRLLEKEPENRYQSAAEVLEVLSSGASTPWAARGGDSPPKSKPTTAAVGYSEAFRAPLPTLPTWEQPACFKKEKEPILWRNDAAERFRRAIARGAWLAFSGAMLSLALVAVAYGLSLTAHESLRTPFLMLSRAKLSAVLVTLLIGHAALLAFPLWGAAIAAGFPLKRQLWTWFRGITWMLGVIVLLSALHLNFVQTVAVKADRPVRPVWYLPVVEAASTQALEAGLLSAQGTTGTFRISPPIVVWLRSSGTTFQQQSFLIWLSFAAVLVSFLMKEVVRSRSLSVGLRLAVILILPAVVQVVLPATEAPHLWRFALGRFDQSVDPAQLVLWSVAWGILYLFIARHCRTVRSQAIAVRAEAGVAPKFSKHARGG